MYGVYGKLPGPRSEYVTQQGIIRADKRRKRNKPPIKWLLVVGILLIPAFCASMVGGPLLLIIPAINTYRQFQRAEFDKQFPYGMFRGEFPVIEDTAGVNQL